MDEGTKLFLKRIAESIGALLIWMMANIFFGIYKGYGFFMGAPNWQNIVYYFLFILTGVILYIYIVKKWKSNS